jgi:hypothetical protein
VADCVDARTPGLDHRSQELRVAHGDDEAADPEPHIHRAGEEAALEVAGRAAKARPFRQPDRPLNSPFLVAGGIRHLELRDDLFAAPVAATAERRPRPI